MILVSQKNKAIAILDNIKIVEIDNIGGKYTISVHLQDNYCKKLAEYDTEERAVEILTGLTNASVAGYKKYVLPEV